MNICLLPARTPSPPRPLPLRRSPQDPERAGQKLPHRRESCQKKKSKFIFTWEISMLEL